VSRAVGDAFSLVVLGLFLCGLGVCALARKTWFNEFYDRATSRKNGDGILTFQRFFFAGVTLLCGIAALVGAILVLK
jgi:hypothetical protein